MSRRIARVMAVALALTGPLVARSPTAHASGVGANVETWNATVASLPTTEYGLAAATGADGTLYAMGGTNGSVLSSAVYAYTPGANGSLGSWATVAPLPAAEYNLTAAKGPDGRIYAMGGYNGSAVSSAVYAYAPGGASWVTVASLPTAEYGLAAATGAGPGGSVYAIGGFTGSAYSSAVYGYTPPDKQKVGHPPGGGEPLLPVYHPLFAVSNGVGLEKVWVAAALGLSHRVGGEHLLVE